MRKDSRTPARLAALGPCLLVLMLLAAATSPWAPGSAASEPGPAAPPALVEVSQETDVSRTRVIIRATGPIDYRGGRLHGDQVIIDLANVDVMLASPVVELHTPEVARLIVGPEVSIDGERLLKVRLTGVKARTHKVIVNGNELYIDLIPREGARERKGLPKLIKNDSEVTT